MRQLLLIVLAAVALSACTNPENPAGWYDGPLKKADGTEVLPPSYGDVE